MRCICGRHGQTDTKIFSDLEIRMLDYSTFNANLSKFSCIKIFCCVNYFDHNERMSGWRYVGMYTENARCC